MNLAKEKKLNNKFSKVPIRYFAINNKIIIIKYFKEIFSKAPLLNKKTLNTYKVHITPNCTNLITT